MTPDEKIVLQEIEELGGSANAVLISRKLNLNPVDYANYLCKRLRAKGYLEREKAIGKEYPVYKIREKDE